MNNLFRQLIQTASRTRRFLDNKSRRDVAAFIRARKHPSGGFCGRDREPDLYYTFFAIASLRALGQPVPFFRLWNFVRSFGCGDGLDLVHLACLIQLRCAFPMSGKTRRRFFQCLEKHPAASAYDRFLKQLACDRLRVARFPAAPPEVVLAEPTPNLAAAATLNPRSGRTSVPALLERACPRGGFAAGAQLSVPDLLSTATALFALTRAGADLSELRRPCLDYVESLWRDSGGFAGHVFDEFEDVEYTFYALLSIGCLME
jgi:hypothetical protein